jgi:hypothetical protein
VDGHRVLGRTDDEVAGGLDRCLLEEDFEAALLATHDSVEHGSDGSDRPIGVLDLGGGDVLDPKAEDGPGPRRDGCCRSEQVHEKVTAVDGVLEERTPARLLRIGAP